MTSKLSVGALAAALLMSGTACEPSAEPLEESPSNGVARVASATVAPTEPAPTEPAPGTDTGPDIYMVDPETGSAGPFLSSPESQTNAEVSPDGTRVVYESRSIPGLPSQIVVREAADGTTRQLTSMEGGAFDPTWSPDGTQIAFAGTRLGTGDRWPDSDIFVMDVDGGRVRRFASTEKHDGHPDWSPDGSRIAFHGRYLHDSVPAGFIWVASASTGALTQVIGGRWWAAIDPSWSPDGRWIAYGGFGGDTLNGRVYTSWLGLVRPNGTQGSRRLRKAATYHLIENPSWSPDGRRIVFEENDPPAVGIRWDGHMGNVGVIDVRTERLRWVVRGAASDQPSWAPDGILVNLSPADVDSMSQPTLQTGWLPTWEPSWTRPDATVVLTGSGCELDGDVGVLHPGVLTIEFVNDSYREASIKVVRVPSGRGLGDLRAGPAIGAGWGQRNAPEATDVWSSPRAVGSGRWGVVCFKDLIKAPNGMQIVRAGVAGPIEVG